MRENSASVIIMISVQYSEIVTLSLSGRMTYADSVFPDQSANEQKLIWELHCPLNRKIVLHRLMRCLIWSYTVRIWQEMGFGTNVGKRNKCQYMHFSPSLFSVSHLTSPTTISKSFLHRTLIVK